MATLPRLKPKHFYDLVVEVALIRPGPIQGGSVHPYIRRRTGQEPDWEHDHPLLKNALDKTYGVPLFQEQLMQIAVDVAGFSAAEADQLRRAMGAKRSTERMERLRERFYEGMGRNGITGELADRLFEKLMAFANFGFPESHSISFASLVYYSAWFKHYYPAAFCAALLRAQPMGFYSPQSLIADARRHGVVVRGPDVNASLAHATLEPVETGGAPARRRNGPPRPATSRTSSPAASPTSAWPTGRTRRWSTWPGGSTSPCGRPSRWPPPAPSAASASTGGRRCGRPAPRLTSGTAGCRVWSSGWTRRRCRG
jgi:hypothetical protein